MNIVDSGDDDGEEDKEQTGVRIGEIPAIV
jgi:hypothetical protein